jgi:uncharacterized membrane protein YfcA
MLGNLSWEYWYVFPYAVFVAIFANASGFSGAVLFQPFFNFVLQLPMAQSIATGIATETIGMTSGASRWFLMGKVDKKAVKFLLPWVLLGVFAGLSMFVQLSPPALRLSVGLIVGGIATAQLIRVVRNRLGARDEADLDALKNRKVVAGISGVFSACTGTGVAEMNQPLLENRGQLQTHKANATAIVLEACADWMITAVNLTLGNLRFDILVFSASGVLIGAQIGAALSPYLPARLLKGVFGLCVLGIACVYCFMGARHFLGL